MEIKDYILQAVADFKINLTEIQLSQLEIYYKLLVSRNEKINLTAITEPEDVAVKHFADSLSMLAYVDVPKNSTVIDVGTGAGFPGVVLKIARPDIKLTLLDSLNKRLVFLQEVLDEINLSADLIHSRAEDGGQNTGLRETYDFALSRAVARLNVLSEYCLPYVRLGGKFVAFKSKDADTELKDARKAVQSLGGRVADVHRFSLPSDGGDRAIIEIEKIQPTPEKYPRNSAKIKSMPL